MERVSKKHGAAKNSIRPLFVFGSARSGTTWVSNILMQTGEVYAPRRPDRGHHESVFFADLLPYCNLGKTDNDLLAIRSIFERSLFFELLSVPPGEDILARGAPGYFKQVMERAASQAGARFWLEKTPRNTIWMGELMQWFPEGAFVVVDRAPKDVIRSFVHQLTDPGSPRAWARAGFVRGIYLKIIGLHQKGCTRVRYDDLVDDYERTVLNLFRDIGLEASEVPISRYRRNTSFQGERPPIKAWQYVCAMVPFWCVGLFPARLIERIVIGLSNRRRYLPRFFFLQKAEVSAR